MQSRFLRIAYNKKGACKTGSFITANQCEDLTDWHCPQLIDITRRAGL